MQPFLMTSASFGKVVRLAWPLLLAFSIMPTFSVTASADAVDDMLERDRQSGGFYGVNTIATKARTGDAKAQRVLGIFLVEGTTGFQNVTEGLRWLQKAGNAGDAMALRQLGFYYDSGRYFIADHLQAVDWYEKAFEHGEIFSARHIASIYSFDIKNPEKASLWFKKGAEAGDDECQRIIGEFYATGHPYFPRDYTLSLRWLLKSLEPRSYYVGARYIGRAQAIVATFYERGLGTFKNMAEAIRWYRLAAENEDPYASYTLAMHYERGEGVPVNLAEAMKWYWQSAEWNYSLAQYRLGLAFYRGEVVARDAVQAAKWVIIAVGGCCSEDEKTQYDQVQKEAYSDFQKEPLLSRLDWYALELAMHDAAEKDLARIKSELSPEQNHEAEKLAQDFRPETWPIPIP